jgi:hypothetical protein
VIDPSGKGLIFVTGAPGSKWSAISHAVMYAQGINTSDLSMQRAQSNTPLHFGNYFGPGMEYGDRFADLPSMSREDLLREFARPYEHVEGTLLLKSHLFSRHLPALQNFFPAARFLLVHRSDQQCLSWWQQSGGFRISFPDYTWYEDSANMALQIALDNAGIAAFAQANGKPLKRHRSLAPVLAQLGLSYATARTNELGATPFEVKYGFGGRPAAEIEADCHATARLASLCVV